MGKIAPRSSRVNALRGITEALSAFLEKYDAKEHSRLTLLWSHWKMVMGEELSSLAMPLGHKKDVLIIAAEDSMAAQDIAMQADEVLARANAFMNANYFSRIQVELAMGRYDLSRGAHDVRQRPLDRKPPKPDKLGSLSGVIDPESPVGKCYEAYLRFFSRTE